MSNPHILNGIDEIIKNGGVRPSRVDLGQNPQDWYKFITDKDGIRLSGCVPVYEVHLPIVVTGYAAYCVLTDNADPYAGPNWEVIPLTTREPVTAYNTVALVLDLTW